jgi:hypothetical protein
MDLNPDRRSDRIDTIGWGLLFIAVGLVVLVPSMPEGAWLVAAGLVMLGSAAARAVLRLPIHEVTVGVGGVALAAGIASVAGLTTAVGPLALIVLGLSLIVGALYRVAPGTTGEPIPHGS